MRTVLTVFLMLLSAPLFAQFNVKLSLTIDSLYFLDQEYRNQLKQGDRMLLNKATRQALQQKIAQTDSLNYLALRAVFKKHGYPGTDKVGKRISHHFWLLMQHQDKHPAFQDSVVAAMKPELDKKNVTPADFAIFVDRLCINEGTPQVYGTQLQLSADSATYEVKPCIERESLNGRRKSIGLNTIEEYILDTNASRIEQPKKK